MLTKTAIYWGKTAVDMQEEFFRGVREELEPIWQRIPQGVAIPVQRLRTSDADARAVPKILEIDFPDQVALEACPADGIRNEAHAAALAAMKLLNGRFYHPVTEATVLPPAAA